MTDNRPDDDILDERIRSLASAHYHAPEGGVPRDAMWAQIAAARRTARAAGAAEATHGADVVPLAPRRRPRTVVFAWGSLLAAGLVLGIAIERNRHPSGTGGDSARSGAIAQKTPSTPNPDSARDTSSPTVTPSAIPGVREDVARTTPRADAPAPRERVAPRAPETYAARTTAPRELPAVSDSTVQTLYRAAAVQTLVQAEALLTAYRGSAGTSRDPQAMQQAARWARDVLSSTRLLLDSPAGRDPQMHMLFADLELILAQIVQLSGTPLQARERELIDRAMRDRDLLPRLRSAVPSGLATS